jgi:hypothetical protein
MRRITTPQELRNNLNWETYCEKNDVDIWAVEHGVIELDDEIILNENDAMNLGFGSIEEFDDSIMTDMSVLGYA